VIWSFFCALGEPPDAQKIVHEIAELTDNAEDLVSPMYVDADDDYEGTFCVTCDSRTARNSRT
jgi:hypothetical protein